MKKINMKAFTVSVRIPDGSTKEINYAIKDSLIEVLFSPTLKLNTINLLKQEILAKKIIECGDELLLEDEEYTRLQSALSKVEGLGKNDIEMVHRVLEATSIEVEPKAS